MSSSTKIMRDLSQEALEKKFQLFLAQLKFIDPQDGKQKSETLPEWALKGLCKGYSFMSVRAYLIDEEETTYQQRLYRLADASENQVIKMGKLLQRYRSKLKTSFTSKEHELLVYAQDLYAFISSLLIAQKPGLIQVDGKGFLSQSDTIEVLKLIPPDRAVSVKQEYTIAFNFTQKELVHVLNTVTRDGDAVFVDSSVHSTRLFVRKKSHRVFLSFVDSAFANGEQLFKAFRVLTNQSTFKDAVHHKYLSIAIKILSKEMHSRPDPGQLVIDILNKRGRDNHINALGASRSTALHMAAEEGCDDIVKVALMQGADPTLQDNDKYTPTKIAALRGHTAIIRTLAEYNADIGKDGLEKIAAAHHHHDTARVIKECAEELNQIHLDKWEQSHDLSVLVTQSTDELESSLKANSNHETAIKILYAIRMQDHELLKWFIRNKPLEDARKIAIYFVVTANYIDLNLLQLVCEEDACHGQMSKHRAIAFLMAAQRNRPEIAEHLVEKFADQFTQDQLGVALIHLVTDKHYGIAKTLLQKRPDTNKTWMRRGKNNSLHLAILENVDLEFIKLLCEKNIYIAEQNANNKTALSLAIEKRNYPAVSHFIRFFSDQFTDPQLECAYKDLIAIEEKAVPEELCKTIETFTQSNKLREETKRLAHAKQDVLKIQIENKDKAAPKETISRKRCCSWLFKPILEEGRSSAKKVARTASFTRR